MVEGDPYDLNRVVIEVVRKQSVTLRAHGRVRSWLITRGRLLLEMLGDIPPAVVPPRADLVVVLPQDKPARKPAATRLLLVVFETAWLLLKNFAVIGLLVCIIFYFFPGLYIKSVNLILPPSYYRIGSLGDPSQGYNNLPSWSIDLASVDNDKEHSLSELFIPQVQIARIRKDSYIPGRENPRLGLGEERPGREWDGGKCLFIDDFLLIAERRSQQPHHSPPGTVSLTKAQEVAIVGSDGKLSYARHNGKLCAAADSLKDPDCKIVTREVYPPVMDSSSAPYLSASQTRPKALMYTNISVSEVRRLTGKSGQIASDIYRDNVERTLARLGEMSASAGQGGPVVYSCNVDEPGKICPRIQIWAHGRPAPCSLWPF